MSDQLGPDFDERLQAELDRFTPPTPLPEKARFRQPQRTYARLVGTRLAAALAAGLVVATVMAASAATGTNPSTWPQRAVTTVESVTHVGESNPTPSPETQAPTKPPAKTEPVKTTAPEHESPEPSDGSRPEPKESPEPSSGQSHDHETSPSPSSDDRHSSYSPRPPSDD